MVYGFSCLIAITPFAHRHDKHIVEHYMVPAIGAMMNFVMLGAVVYEGLLGTNTDNYHPRTDAIISLSIVVIWILAGAAWFSANPLKRGHNLLDATVPKREIVSV